jgi:hypothetical protein
MKVQHQLSVIALCVLLITFPLNAASRDEQVLTIPAGTVIPVVMIDSISSDYNYAGQTFRGSLAAPIVAGHRTLVPQGASAHIRLVSADSAGKLKGRSDLGIQLVRVGNYNVHSGVVWVSGPSQGKKTGKDAAIGGAVGGGLGLLFGGGKGAAIGAGLGAGAGVGHRYFKGPKPAVIGSESVVNFRLASPVHVRR